MDDSRDFDLDRMMERIRLNVHDKRRLAESAGTPEVRPAAGPHEVERDLATLHSAYDLAGVSLDPHRRIFGRTILTAANFLSHLLKPLIRRQTEYNAANTRLTDYLTRDLERLRPEFAQMRAVTEGALARNLEEFKALMQASARRFAQLHGDDIAMHARALDEMSHRIAALEQRDADLREQLRRVETLEGRQIEVRQELDRRETSHSEALDRLTQQTQALAQQHLQRSETLERSLDGQRQSLEAQNQRLDEQSQGQQAQGQRLEQVDARYAQITAQIQAHYAQVSAQVETNYAQVGAQIETRYAEIAAQLEAAREAHSNAQAQARKQYDEFLAARERLLHAERRLRRILSAGNGNSQPAPHEPLLAAVPPAAEMDYAGFEDRLRASEMVKDKQRIYVPYFAGKGPVLDVGCGRGEFLELMGAAGTEARGLDLDLDMVLLCKEKGLDAARCDAIEYLANASDDSLGGIFSAQVIEHLTSAQLTALVSLAARKLRRGGVIVLETLNPESLFVHYKWFWMDLSHVRLVHPQTLACVLEWAGFVGVAVNFASPPPRVLPIPPLPAGGPGSIEGFNRATDYLNRLIYGDQEYFMVGRK